LGQGVQKIGIIGNNGRLHLHLTQLSYQQGLPPLGQGVQKIGIIGNNGRLHLPTHLDSRGERGLEKGLEASAEQIERLDDQKDFIELVLLPCITLLEGLLV